MDRRGWALWAIAATVATGCAGESAEPIPNVVQPGAPGETSRVLTPDEVAAAEAAAAAVASAYGSADVAFVQGMIHHHAQAIEMVALVADRAAHPDIAVLAERLGIGQADEIAQMERWLSERGEPLGGDHSGHAMPGLLTDVELAALAASTGAAFDEAFLVAMSRHHQGAVEMVAALFAAGGGTETSLATLANHIASEQQVEISRMTALLAELSA